LPVNYKQQEEKEEEKEEEEEEEEDKKEKEKEKVEERNHEFYERVFHKRRNCAVCEKAIVGIKRENRTALNCIGCAKIVHKSCLPKIENEKCRSVINNNNNNNIERKNEEGNVCLEDIYCNRGLAYYHDSQYDKAIKDFNKAIQLLSKDDSLVPEEKNKKLCVCYGNKGLAYFYLNNLEKAIKEFTRAMEISSDPVFFCQQRSNLQHTRDCLSITG